MLTKSAESRGVLIVVEGVDGAGKSTVARKLADALSGTCRTVLTTEPTHQGVGGLIRKVLTGQEQTPPAASVLHLFLADRIAHCQEMKLALDEGKVVICDRYMVSSLVYQCKGDVTIAYGLALHETAPLLRPDLTVWLDLPAEKAYQRVHRRQDSMASGVSIFEKSLAFFENHQQRYASILTLLGHGPPDPDDGPELLQHRHQWGPTLRIDADREETAVAVDTIAQVRAFLGLL